MSSPMLVAVLQVVERLPAFSIEELARAVERAGSVESAWRLPRGGSAR